MASKTKAKLDPQANFPRWRPPDLHADAGREAHQKICQFLIAKTCSIFLNQVCYLMLKVCWLWFVILKKYVELTRPKIESRDPIFFIGTRACSRVSGNDRLFPRGSEFGPNLEIPASPVIQLRPRPGYSNLQVVIAFLCKYIRCQLPQLSISGYQNRWKSIWTPVVGTTK